MPNSISIMSDSFYNVVKTHPVKWKHGMKQRVLQITYCLVRWIKRNRCHLFLQVFQKTHLDKKQGGSAAGAPAPGLCNLRSGNHFACRNIRTTRYGIETISNLAAEIWDLLPEEIKNASSLSVFKTKIKKCIPKKCPFKLCHTHIKNIGFI